MEAQQAPSWMHETTKSVGVAVLGALALWAVLGLMLWTAWTRPGASSVQAASLMAVPPSRASLPTPPTLDPEAARREAAWQLFYARPGGCGDTVGDAFVECAVQQLRTRRAFDAMQEHAALEAAAAASAPKARPRGKARAGQGRDKAKPSTPAPRAVALPQQRASPIAAQIPARAASKDPAKAAPRVQPPSAKRARTGKPAKTAGTTKAREG